MTSAQTKEELTEKVGKLSFIADDKSLAAKLNYESGIKSFDDFLNGKSLRDIDAVIHLVKYPKGLVMKIAQNFSSFGYGLGFIEIKRTLLSEKPFVSHLVFEATDNRKIIFGLQTADIYDVQSFLDEIKLKYEFGHEKAKTEQAIKLGDQQSNATKQTNTTKHGMPTLLSFFVPGLGQLIKGHFLKAIAIWASAAFVWFAFFGSLMAGRIELSIVVLIIPSIVWLWNVYDAYNAN